MQSTHRRTLLKTAGAGLIGSLGVGLIGNVFAAGKIKPAGTSALIVVDVQNCFVDGGTLPVSKGAEVVPIINKLAGAFENIVVTQDWHTQGHASFATSYPGKKVFETTKLSYGTQVLWPDHCVQGTDDAALHKDLKLPTAQVIVRKGYHKAVDSYSAFEEADHKTLTGLAGYLKQRGIGVLITDHNVRETLRIVDRGYIIHQGKVMTEGSGDFLINDEQARELYLGKDFNL